MATTISTQDLENVKEDIEDIGEAVNEKAIVYPRYGEPFKSLPMISAEFQISSDAAEAAAVSAAESANIAQSSSQIAQSSANIAEAAATAATIGAGVFNTPEAGVDPVTGVADGAYFNVRSSSDESYVDEYQNVGGSAVATGKSYPSSALVEDMKNNTAYFYPTVAQMVAATNLTDGKVVATKGYHNIFDDGGAVYLISAVGTDYSIPLANGLHAVFNDDFDIRKFGIRDSATLDQSAELLRMRNYADDREYEIDFHNFSVMNPKIATQKHGLDYDTLTLPFHKPHKIKNVKFFSDKTKQLRWHTCPISFLPKEIGNGETFELDNVTFDPYVADYLLHPASGDGDGGMHGFYAGWHRDFNVAWPLNQRIESGYSLKYNNINFTSPAVSYNLACNLRCENITATNIFGEYWGLYIWHWCNVLYAENVHGVFRDDLHTGSGRTLVTNLFQEEQEVGTGGFVYKQSRQEFKNISSVKYTDGTPSAAVVRQNMGKPTLDTLILDDVRGQVRWFVSNPTELSSDVHINNLIIRNHRIDGILFWCGVDKLKVHNSELQSLINSYNFTYNDVFFENVVMPNTCPFLGGAVNKFHGINCTFSSINGFLRGNDVKYGDILLEYPKVTRNWFFEGYATSFTILGGNIGTTTLSNFITIKDDGVTTIVPVTISGVTFSAGIYAGEKLISALGNKAIRATVTRNTFQAKPLIDVGTGGSLRYSGNDSRAVSLTYDPPSIPANSAVTRDVPVPNAVIGEGVLATFSVYNADIEVSAVISSDGNAAVKFKNTSAVEVNLPSGTLTVKLI